MTASFPAMGQVSLIISSPFNLSPPGCSFASDYTKTDLFKDLTAGVTFLMSGPGINGSYVAGYNPYPSNISTGVTSVGVSGTSAPLLSLTSQSMMQWEVSGQQANHVLSFTH